MHQAMLEQKVTGRPLAEPKAPKQSGYISGYLLHGPCSGGMLLMYLRSLASHNSLLECYFPHFRYSRHYMKICINLFSFTMNHLPNPTTMRLFSPSLSLSLSLITPASSRSLLSIPTASVWPSLFLTSMTDVGFEAVPFSASQRAWFF